MSDAASSPSAWEQALSGRKYNNLLSDPLTEFEARPAIVEYLHAAASTPSTPLRKDESGAFDIDKLFLQLRTEHILRNQLVDLLRAGSFSEGLGRCIPSLSTNSPEEKASHPSYPLVQMASVVKSLHSNWKAEYNRSSVAALKELLQGGRNNGKPSQGAGASFP